MRLTSCRWPTGAWKHKWQRIFNVDCRVGIHFDLRNPRWARLHNAIQSCMVIGQPGIVSTKDAGILGTLRSLHAGNEPRFDRNQLSWPAQGGVACMRMGRISWRHRINIGVADVKKRKRRRRRKEKGTGKEKRALPHHHHHHHCCSYHGEINGLVTCFGTLQCVCTLHFTAGSSPFSPWYHRLADERAN